MAKFRHFEDLWSHSGTGVPHSRSYFMRIALPALFTCTLLSRIRFFFPKKILIANFLCLFAFLWQFQLITTVFNLRCTLLIQCLTSFGLRSPGYSQFPATISFLTLERRKDFGDFPTDRQNITASRAQIFVNPTFRRADESWITYFGQIPDPENTQARFPAVLWVRVPCPLVGRKILNRTSKTAGNRP